MIRIYRNRLPDGVILRKYDLVIFRLKDGIDVVYIVNERFLDAITVNSNRSVLSDYEIDSVQIGTIYDYPVSVDALQRWPEYRTDDYESGELDLHDVFR